MSRKALITLIIILAPVEVFLIYATYFTKGRTPAALWREMTTPVYTMRVEVSTGGENLPGLSEQRKALFRRIDTVLRNRVDAMDYVMQVTEINDKTGNVIYEVSNVKDTNGIAGVFQRPGNLAFYKTYELSEVFSYFDEANKKLVDIVADGKSSLPGNTGPVGPSLGDELFGDKKQDSTEIAEQQAIDNAVPELSQLHNPLFTLLNLNINGTSTGGNTVLGEGPVIGYAFSKDTATINTYLGLDAIRSIFPIDLKLMWGKTPVGDEKNVFQLFAIRHYPQLPPAITGGSVTKASAGFDVSGIPEVDLELNITGASAFERITEEAANQYPKRCIAIVIDGTVFSAPRVQQRISGGRVQLTGIDNYEEAQALASAIVSGSLPVAVNVTAIKTINKKSFHLPYARKDPYEDFEGFRIIRIIRHELY